MASEGGYIPHKEDFPLFEGKGCNYCSKSGFSGRIGLFELLAMTDAVSRGVSQGLDLLDLRKLAEQEGFKSLFMDGLDKVKEGATTFSEVIRVSRGTENGAL